MRIFLPLFLGAISISGCVAHGGDMIVRVSGKLSDSAVSSEDPAVCELSMLALKNDQVISSKQVSGSFSTTMMVVAVPIPEHYYFTAECGDGRRFRSGDVAISSRRSHSRQFDLGVLDEDAP